MTTPTARARLAAAAAAAGYPAALLTQIATATLPAYRPGDTLTDRQVEHVTHALETLLEAGHTPDTTGELIARHQHRGDDRWRDALWTDVLHAANARHTPHAPPAAP